MFGFGEAEVNRLHDTLKSTFRILCDFIRGTRPRRGEERQRAPTLLALSPGTSEKASRPFEPEVSASRLHQSLCASAASSLAARALDDRPPASVRTPRGGKRSESRRQHYAEASGNTAIGTIAVGKTVRACHFGHWSRVSNGKCWSHVVHAQQQLE